MCGEKCQWAPITSRGLGSPPRVRGKAVQLAKWQRPAGITPACAGKRLSSIYSNLKGKDHPRVCGEKSMHREPHKMKRGSPPRVRGKENKTNIDRTLAGITPACAGKRTTNRSGALKHWDHPRVCGEKKETMKNSPDYMGSPPRVRGKDRQPKTTKRPSGITPACAGKRLLRNCSPLQFGDHPRVCGEK